MLNTNVDGRKKVMVALTAIPGVGRRVSNIICKKAEVDMRKRAGELSADEIEKLVSILSDPKKFKIPAWMLNRRRDKVDGKSFQMVSNIIATKLREDIEALKKVRAHRGLRHYWGVKVRGQVSAPRRAPNTPTKALTAPPPSPAAHRHDGPWPRRHARQCRGIQEGQRIKRVARMCDTASGGNDHSLCV